ncbi:RNA polymerase sigma factor [Streptomyces gamaensis]|uniref:RNA polymerase sigma factor n=1 Tax=Streptomyces gamaensis TaxID=1763542 RepID=A0ABW0ZC36_9ACTN
MIAQQDAEAELLERSRSGDREAFAELYRRHSGAALAFARSLPHVHDADDLAADAFLQVFKALCKGLGPDTSFRSYLLSVVGNAANRRHHRMAQEVLVDTFSRYDTAEPRPQIPDRVADRCHLADLLAELPVRTRAVLWFSAVEGRSAKDVAEQFGMTANAVSALLYRTRFRLHRLDRNHCQGASRGRG